MGFESAVEYALEGNGVPSAIPADCHRGYLDEGTGL